MLAERIDSWNEQLRKESRQEGRLEGRQEVLLRLLEKRFGPVSQAARDRIAGADAGLLLEWIDRVLTADSLTGVFGG